MIEAIYNRCEYCTTEETFHGPDPEQESKDAGWFYLMDHEDEDLAFCSGECLKSWLF